MSSTEKSQWLTINNRTGKTLMQILFDRLDGMYPKHWRAQFEGKEPAITDQNVRNWTEAWASAFESRSIAPRMIARALENCMDMYEWPPSLPQFLKACTTPSRNEQVTPPEAQALTYEAKFNPEMAAKAAQVITPPEEESDGLAWVHRLLRKFPNGSNSQAYKAALQVAKERGITT